jgi:hypothetical protein
MTEILIFCALIILGFWLPGYQIARALRASLAPLAAFFWSWMVLFSGVLAMNLLGISCTRSSVAWCLIGVLIAATVAAWRVTGKAFELPRLPRTRFQSRTWLMFAVLPVGAALLIMALRAWHAPLTGWDASWRWNFLAVHLLEAGNYNAFPAFEAADFKHYFWPDGMGPMVAVLYFWPYASAGSTSIALTAVPVFLQYALLLACIYLTAVRLYGVRAAVLAVGMASATSALFWSVHIGQETGLTALGMIGAMTFAVRVRDDKDYGNLASAAAAASLAALSREYGGAMVACGLLALFWRRIPLRGLLTYGVISAALFGPWYLRNMVITGNPFYNLGVGPLFPLNEIHLMRQDGCVDVYGWRAGGIERVVTALSILLATATIPLLAFFASTRHRWRQHGYLWLSALFVVLLWIYSVPQTSGGLPYSQRVLSPVHALMCVLAAGHLWSLRRSRWVYSTARVVLPLAIFIGVTSNIMAPFTAWSPSMWQSCRMWPKLATRPSTSFRNPGKLYDNLKESDRVLTEYPYLHEMLHRKDIEAVPFWSPEVRFVFDKSLSVDEVTKRLLDAGVTHVAINGEVESEVWFDYPFFKAAPERFPVTFHQRQEPRIYRLSLAD